MIISKTPLRISFFSGGSDLPSFYKKEYGAALSVTIDKFIYVILHKTPNIGIKTMFDDVQELSELDQMQDGIVKESLKYYDVKKELTVASISDILSRGSGLGSSSSFTVGLINALHKYKMNQTLDKEDNAKIACDIEMNKCSFPVGKQDQYAATYGGFNLFEFYDNEKVNVNKIAFTENWIKLQNNLMLVYSGKGRSANSILQKQKDAMSDKVKFDLVKKSRDKAYTALKYFNSGDIDSFGYLLHEAWMDKKSVVKEITQSYFDDIYERALDAGCLGGKLLGAGGGGFFIFYVPLENQENVRSQITKNTECKVYDFKFYNNGTQIINNIRNDE